jgi:hypothetical protein
MFFSSKKYSLDFKMNTEDHGVTVVCGANQILRAALIAEDEL